MCSRRASKIKRSLIFVFVGILTYLGATEQPQTTFGSATMSLSSVVSSLVRAQMGSSVNSTVTDEDLDRHIADLIVKEAKAKAERYKTDGVRAYLRKG